MNKKIGGVIICFLLFICSGCQQSMVEKEKNRLEISTLAQLQDFSYKVWYENDKYNGFKDYEIILMNDIDGKNSFFSPIGKNLTISFQGTFNGNNHTISNLKILVNNNSAFYIGFFGYTYGAEINNVTFKNISVVSQIFYEYKTHVGGIIGFAANTTIRDCIFKNISVEVKVISSQKPVYSGIIIGSASNVNLIKIYSSGEIYGENSGGLIGFSHSDLTISRSFVEKTKVVGNQFAGGLVGIARKINLDRSKFNGEVTSNQTVGGLCGSASSMNVRDSGFEGTLHLLKDKGRIGGFSAFNDESKIMRSYFNGTINALEQSKVGYFFAENETGIKESQFCLFQGQIYGGLINKDYFLKETNVIVSKSDNLEEIAKRFNEKNEYDYWRVENSYIHLLDFFSIRDSFQLNKNEEGFYPIKTKEAMKLISVENDEKFHLYNDIHFDNQQIVPFNLHYPFSGILKGNNQTISRYQFTYHPDIFVNNIAQYSFFGNIEGGVIENLTFSNSPMVIHFQKSLNILELHASTIGIIKDSKLRNIKVRKDIELNLLHSEKLNAFSIFMGGIISRGSNSELNCLNYGGQLKVTNQKGSKDYLKIGGIASEVKGTMKMHQFTSYLAINIKNDYIFTLGGLIGSAEANSTNFELKNSVSHLTLVKIEGDEQYPDFLVSGLIGWMKLGFKELLPVVMNCYTNLQVEAVLKSDDIRPFMHFYSESFDLLNCYYQTNYKNSFFERDKEIDRSQGKEFYQEWLWYVDDTKLKDGYVWHFKENQLPYLHDHG